MSFIFIVPGFNRFTSKTFYFLIRAGGKKIAKEKHHDGGEEIWSADWTL